MTALAGYWSFGGEDAGEAVARMLRVQALYGPAGPAQTSAGLAAFGRALFELLPEDAYDRGPVAMPGGGLLVADVRLDNRSELAEALGIDIRRLSDTAVLAAAVAAWGEDAVDRIQGDFAFAWWDAPNQRLVLARDYLGARPLNFHLGDGFVAFASMPKGLHALPQIPRAPRVDAIATAMALVPDTGEETMWEGILRVPSANLAVITRDGLRLRRWWDPERRPIEYPRDEEYVEALREQVDAAVRRRLRGVDGVVASHLSSGLDSTMVTATAARLFAPGRVVAYTSVPTHPSPTHRSRRSDEGPIASAAAALYPNIEHVKIRSGLGSPFDEMDRNVEMYDGAVPNLCNQQWYDAINNDIRDRGIHVLLTGMFGNFSFSHAGNDYLPELFRQGRWLEILRMTPALRRAGMRWRGIAYNCVDPLLPAWLRGLFGQNHDVTRYSGLRRDALDRFGIAELGLKRGFDLRHRAWRDGFALRIIGIGRTDIGIYQKGHLANWGIDLRSPAADRRLVEFCLGVPPRQFLLGGDPRSLLRRAAADRLPPEVTGNYRIGLHGSDWWVPLGKSLDQAREELDRIADCAPAREIIDVERLRRSIDEWPADGWERADVIQKYRLALIRTVAIGHFIRRASGSNR